MRFIIWMACVFAFSAIASTAGAGASVPSQVSVSFDRLPAQWVASKTSTVRWLVISSRADEQEAISVAESFAATLGPAIVAQSNNGSFAVIVGFLSQAKAKQNLSALKSIHLVPPDSFLSLGQKFPRVVWASAGAIDAAEFVQRSELRRTVRRLQSALKRLGLYLGEVDGNVGPATSSAFFYYEQRFGVPPTDALTEFDIASIEQTAQDGFATASERERAVGAGFKDADTFGKAQKGGFQKYFEYDEATRAGFSTKAEYDDFVASGFSAKSDYDSARAQGIHFRADYEKHLQKKREESENEAASIIDDADAFLKINPSTSAIVDLTRKAAALKAILGTHDWSNLQNRYDEFETELQQLNGFGAFRAARSAERQAARVEAIDALSKQLRAKEAAVQTWMARNLTNQAAADLADELVGVEKVLSTATIPSLTNSLKRLDELLARWGIKTEIETIISNGGKPSPGTEKPEVTVEQTARNAFLLNGSGDQIVALYNSSPNAPSLIKNLVGDFVFEKGKAFVCMYPLSSDAALRRAIRAELGAMDAKDIIFNKDACSKSDLLKDDVFLLTRRDFLKAETSFALAVLEGLETGTLRKFESLSDNRIKDRQVREEQERQAISADVRADARTGFGALALSATANSLCLIVEGDQKAHAKVLQEVTSFVKSETGRQLSPFETDPEGAFRRIQRNECGALYASQRDLKTIVAALESDGRDFRFLPVWFDAAAAEAATRQIAEQARTRTKAQEDRRIAAEEARKIEVEKKRVFESEAPKREAVLREKYGPAARSLQQQLGNAVNSFVMRSRSSDPGSVAVDKDFSSLFPKFASWRLGLEPEFWSPIGVSTEVADYGSAKWKDRQLPLILLEVTVTVESAKRGERKRHCFFLGLLDDGEYKSSRDPIDFPCADSSESLAKWKTGHDFESHWKVADAAPP